MTLEYNSKKLSELRVVDLKAELEKRKLDCSGVKAVLLKKLEKALQDEGEDPETYTFSFSPSKNTKGEAIAVSKDDGCVNGDDKSDDEKPVSDDEALKTDGDENAPIDEDNEDNNKKDEKSDDERPASDEESPKDEVEEQIGNELSDDEKQAEEERQEIIDEQDAQEDAKMSDDENPTPEEKQHSLAIQKELEEECQNEDEDPQLSDDQMEDMSDKKESDVNEEIEGKEEDVDDTEEADCTEEMECTDEAENTEETTEEVKDADVKKDLEEDDTKETVKQDTTESQISENDTSTSTNEDSKASSKKLRPRITAPSEDGNSTKTPVLKKDITLPPAKPKDEEFIVPEKEADIYDKEKFIVKDDTMGDNEETVMDFEEDISNMDNEDSINLTIGEDDAKFMTEEAGLDIEDKDASGEQRRADKKKGSQQLQQEGEKLRTSIEKEDHSKARSLWVSGLSSATRATDLKHLFTKHGKVIAAKIVTNAKTPGARCYGFVTMAAHEDANACIKALNLTELHGRLISVEPVADKPASKKMDDQNRSPNRIDKEKDRSMTKSDSSKREHDGDLRRNERGRIRDYDRRRMSRERDRDRRDHHGGGRHDVLSFEQIKAERKKQKIVAIERELREHDRRKREEIMRQRDIERRNREEALRLEREREKLKFERERIERERAELLILERARLEREKEELKRQKLRLEEDRKLKRSLTEREEYGRSKRSTPDFGRHYGGHHRSPGRHFDRSAELKKSSHRRENEHCRDRYLEVSKHEETHKIKERFSERSMGSSKRDERKEHRRSRSPRRRSRERASNPKGYKYPDPVYGNGKASFSGASESWSHSESRSKPESASWSRSAPPPPPTSDRWPSQVGGSISSSGSSRIGQIYPSNSSSIPPNISMNSSSMIQYPDRFDAYKAPINRKY